MQLGVAKLWIALFALVVALAATGAHADACYSHSSFGGLYYFGDHSGDPLSPTDAGVIAQGRDGNLWSTTPFGGSTSCSGGCGTAFKLTPGGKLTVFDFTSSDGQPYSGLTLGTDGNFYGTTSNGGAHGDGTVFQLTPKSTLKILWNFEGGNDGENPYAPPIEGTDGNFYGTTYKGGINNVGTIYQLTPSGKLTTMYQFPGYPKGGAYPLGVLVQGTDGNLYGTTTEGGAYNVGTIFEISPFGNFAFTTLFSFDGTDGSYPYAGLVQGSNGNFYGTTNEGGDKNAGVVFEITPKGVFTYYSLNGSTNGAQPWGLVQATDGNFYGAATNAGNGYGTIFRITPALKTFTACEAFSGTTGANSRVAPMQHTNGTLYGDTTEGGDVQNTGVFYHLDLGFRPFVSLLPTSGKVGATIEILGQGFVAEKTTVVFFNGKTASSNVVSSTYMTATVPMGATTGFVTVTTPTATLQSNKKFRVTK